MDRTAQQTPQQRDMVFCHECENEWFRDEHGLTCPECQSDFTEIIEANHDPRDDHLPEPEPPGHYHGMPGLEPPGHDHGEYYGAPDPDEEDIDGFHWRQEGPGQMHGEFNRTYTFGGGDQRGQQQQQPQQAQQGGGVFGMLGSLMQGALGGMVQPQQQQRPQSPNAGQDNRAASQPPSGSPRGTTVRHYNSAFGHVTIATSSTQAGNLFPRNANGPQPLQAQPNDLDQIMQQMFMNIGAFGPGGTRGMAGNAPGGMMIADAGGLTYHTPAGVAEPPAGGMGMGAGMPGAAPQHPFAGHGPLTNIFQMLGMGMPGGAGFGDAVFSQEELDRVITRLMEQNQTGHAPGPASEAAITNLPVRPIEKKDLGDNGKAECTICMDEVNVGDGVTVLPCQHWFHGDCIKAWLIEHDTCPHCRQGIMPKDEPETDRPRQPEQAPHHDTSFPQSVPGSFPAGNTQGPSSQPPRPSSSVPETSASTRSRAALAAERRARQGEGGNGNGDGATPGPRQQQRRRRDRFAGIFRRHRPPNPSPPAYHNLSPRTPHQPIRPLIPLDRVLTIYGAHGLEVRVYPSRGSNPLAVRYTEDRTVIRYIGAHDGEVRVYPPRGLTFSVGPFLVRPAAPLDAQASSAVSR